MNKKGFTLIELVVAIAIMGVIMVIALPAINTFSGDNEKKKYEAYEKTLKSAAKLYTDAYDEDLFGYKNTGCQMVKYSDLASKHLIEDIPLKGVSCKDPDNTYVYVYKDKNSNHSYYSNIICRKDGAVIYQNKERDVTSCGLEDGQAPVVILKTKSPVPSGGDLIEKPYNNGLFESEGIAEKAPSVEVTLKDVNADGEGAIGLRPGYQNLKYEWCKQEVGSANCSTVTTGSLSALNPKEYFVTEMKTTINAPADMTNDGGKDTYYSLYVTGTVQDMDNNTKTVKNRTEAIAAGWQPDYERETNDKAYDVEKHKKCPSYTFLRNGNTISTSSLSSGNYWVNGNENKILLKVAPNNTGITKFNPKYTQLTRSVNGGTYSDYASQFTTTQSYRIGENFNGNLRFGSYYGKKSGTKKYKCSNTHLINFDYDKPTASLSLGSKTGDYRKATAKGDDGHGYENQIQIKANCTDPTSKVALKLNNSAKNPPYPFYTINDKRGTHKYTVLCTDLASNKDSKSASYRVLLYTENCSKCGVKVYKQCRNPDCGCETYKRAAKCGCQTYNSCRHSSCGCQTYNRGSSCSCQTYNSCKNSSCRCVRFNWVTYKEECGCSVWGNGSKTAGTGRKCVVKKYCTKYRQSGCLERASCRAKTCGCQTRNRCAAAGCATYKSCRNSSCSCQTHKRCAAAGCQTWKKCRATGCGCETGNKCWY